MCCSDYRIDQTPLCVAAYHGHEAIVEFLIQSGANIDGKCSEESNYIDDWKVYGSDYYIFILKYPLYLMMKLLRHDTYK